MKIRLAAIDDAKNIYHLVKQFATSFTPDEETFNESLKNILNDKSADLFIAETNGMIVGYCLGFIHDTFYANGKVSWIEEITIDDAFREKGIGSKLMEHFELRAKDRDSKLIALSTRRASGFYSKLGYELSAEYFRKIF